MHKPHTLAELKAELAKVEDRLKRYNEIAMERIRLLELIRAWETAFPDESEGNPTQPRAKFDIPQFSESTESFAHRSLSEFGAMTTSMLLKSVRQKGWKGSDNDEKDRNRLYAVMKRRPEMFSRTQDGLWDAIESAKQ